MPPSPRPSDEIGRLAELKRYGILATPPEVEFDRITKLAGRLFQTPISLLSFVAEDRQWFKSCVGLGLEGSPRSDSFCTWALLDNRPMVIPDALEDPRFACNPLVTGEPHIRFYAGAPLVSSRGFNLGTLCIIDSKPRPEGLTADETATLTDLAALAMQALDARLVALEILESERQFRTLAESIPHLTWMADETGHIFWYNRRWYEYTGTTLEEMSGWGWEKVHDKAVLPSVLARWRGAISSGEPFDMIFPLRSASGEFRPFLTRVEPVRNAEGQILRWFGTNTDITEQLRTEAELRRMNRELEEFSYVASHDLQEPLRMVNIYTQLILRSANLGDRQQATYAQFVQDGVKRMEVLIKDLLQFARAIHAEEDQGKDLGHADLGEAFSEAQSVLTSHISESGARIECCSLPRVKGETAQIAHVFQNILSNALKYRKPDTAPEIHVTARIEGKAWIISIKDNGIGFDPQYADRIFGLFKRLHKDEYPGTGLGLAICQRIVERYGGKIWAESSPGQGSTFSFSLADAN